MKTETEKTLDALPLGFYHFLSDPNMNFQMNRWLSWGRGADTAAKDELEAMAAKIASHDDWIREFLAHSEAALQRGDTMQAAIHARSAEFFMAAGDKRKAKMRELFVNTVREREGIGPEDILGISYSQDDRDVRLPAIRFGQGGKKGPLVLFGGFDSYQEELIPFARIFAAEGYDVLLFEGPGQGAVLEAGMSMTYRWEEPVSAVLDALGFQDAIVLGISLGGYLALRAAAHDTRIRAVIAWDIIYDFRAVLLSSLAPAARLFLEGCLSLGANGLVNNALSIAMRREPVVAWGIAQGMRVFGARNPAEFFRKAGQFSTAGCSKDITCDVLLLAGRHDHFVPFGMLGRQAKAITRARSLTTRVFTEAESAQSHCQVGNVGLALRTMLEWLEGLAPVRG